MLRLNGRGPVWFDLFSQVSQGFIVREISMIVWKSRAILESVLTELIASHVTVLDLDSKVRYVLKILMNVLQQNHVRIMQHVLTNMGNMNANAWKVSLDVIVRSMLMIVTQAHVWMVLFFCQLININDLYFQIVVFVYHLCLFFLLFIWLQLGQFWSLRIRQNLFIQDPLFCCYIRPTSYREPHY